MVHLVYSMGTLASPPDSAGQEENGVSLTAIDDEGSLGVETSAVIRSAYVMSHINKFVDMLDWADRIYAGFPKEVKECLDEIQDEEPGASFNETTKGRLAISFATLPLTTRANIRTAFQEVAQFVGVWLDDGESESALYGILNPDDIAVIEEMLIFVQRLGSRSTRHLLQFLRAVNSGEWSFCLIQGKGKDSEVRTKYRVSGAVEQEFEI